MLFVPFGPLFLVLLDVPIVTPSRATADHLWLRRNSSAFECCPQSGTVGGMMSCRFARTLHLDFDVRPDLELWREAKGATVTSASSSWEGDGIAGEVFLAASRASNIAACRDTHRKTSKPESTSQIHEIEPGLYLSGIEGASRRLELSRLGIAAILNVSDNVDCFFASVFTYQRFRVVDAEWEVLPLDAAVDFIAQHMRAAGSGDMGTGSSCGGTGGPMSGVLVHCFAGVSRSATCVVAFLIRERRLSLVDALRLVSSRRHAVQPNAGFLRQLRAFEAVVRVRQRATGANVLMAYSLVALRSGSHRKQQGRAAAAGAVASVLEHVLAFLTARDALGVRLSSKALCHTGAAVL